MSADQNRQSFARAGRNMSLPVLRWLRSIAICGGLAVLAGCSASVRPAIDSGAQATEGLKEHLIFSATTRRKDQVQFFGGERSAVLNFATARVVVPSNHKPGAADFALREAAYIDSDKAFLDELNKELRTRPRGKRKLFLFIHGFNTSFVDGVNRLTQLVHDAESPAVPVLFSWASRASITNYVYDLNSATAARDDLERTMRLVFQSEAEEINILAHSMGSWVTVEAIRQIVISGRRPPVGKLGHIILASPDLDVDVFKSQMRRMGPPRKPYLLLISKDDIALRASSFLAGGQKRIGADGVVAELTALGAVVVDLSDVKSSDRLGHGKFADLATIGSNLPQVLQRGIAGNGANAQRGVVGTTISVPLAVLGAPIRIITGQQ